MRIAVLALAALVAGEVTAGAAPAVRYEGERVSARFDAVPVEEAVAAIAEASGADVHGTVRVPREVTLELEAVSIDEALGRLLGTQSFTVVYGDGGRPKTIVLRGGPEAPSARPETSPAAGVETKPAELTFPLVLGRMLKRHRPLPLSDPLAQRYGEKELTFAQLLEVATIDEDGMTRALATQVV